MITLNDYLYSGDTVLKILQKYTEDLRKEVKKNHNEVDLVHSNFWSIMISLRPSPRRSGNFTNIWPMNIRFLPLHLKAGSSP